MYSFLKLIKSFGIFAGGHSILLGKGSGKVMNGIKAQHKSDLAYGIFSFTDHLAAGLQL